jgi:zinc transporter
MTEEVNNIEDQILGGRVTEQREQLGRIRRRCTRVRRHFMPEGMALKKLIGHPPAWLEEHDLKLLKGVAESLAFLIDDAGELHERAKLLQEELAS